MKVNYTKEGKLEFDLQDLFENIEPGSLLALIETLSCQDEVIRHVSDQIIDQWTENGDPAKSEPDEWAPLDQAWRKVAKASNDVAKREIERLEKALKYQEGRVRELIQESQRKPYQEL